MSSSSPPRRRPYVEFMAVLARWALGALFVYLGWQKARDPARFLDLVHEYHLIGNPYLLNSIAAALPWFEIFCGLLLVAGVAVRGTALMLVLMLVPFTLVVWLRAHELAIAWGKPFCAVKFDCGCGTGPVFICPKLAENCVQILVAGWLLFSGQGRRWCARFALLRAPNP